MTAGKFYTFAFDLLNPSDGQGSPTITIEMSGVFTCISGPNPGATCSGTTDAGGLSTSCGIDPEP